jgi:hypothetical protein
MVISASRRTDIPALYMPWFMACIEQGEFDVSNPYTRHVAKIPADTDHVHTIVFWSKNFGDFLARGYGENLVHRGYNLFFNFTINAFHPLLEPGMPPLAQRLDQLSRLSRKWGPAAIHWRFDPICVWSAGNGRLTDNLDDFDRIARSAAQAGISVCITSFVDLYRKIKRRMHVQPEVDLIDPPMDEKVDVILKMARLLRKLGMQLHLCCEKEVLAALPPGAHVKAASCIPNDRLADLYGPGISMRRDTGQRMAAGCGCRVSKDIGSYDRHPCRHNCLYCYANPISDARDRRRTGGEYRAAERAGQRVSTR